MNDRYVDKIIVITEGMRTFTALIERDTNLRTMEVGYRYEVIESVGNGTRYWGGHVHDFLPTIQEARARAMLDILTYTRKEEPDTDAKEEATGDTDHSDEPVG